MQKRLLQWLFILGFVILFLPANAQDDTPEAQENGNSSQLSIEFGADFMSRYVWRGTAFSTAPSIQPGIEMNAGGFAIGAWGAYSFDGINNGAEVDLYVSYTFFNDLFSAAITDYFFPLETTGSNNYWRYGEDNTGHVFEGSLSFNGTDGFPFSFLVATNFYGADAKKVVDDPNADNFNEEDGIQYSTYLELAYAFSHSGIDFSTYLGFTPNAPNEADAQTGYIGETGFYGQNTGVVNLGITGQKVLTISETYALPLNVSLITNPMSENIYFVFGISF